MSDLKISQLSDGGASQAADEYVVARSGSNFRIDGASVAAAATSVGTLTSLTVSGAITSTLSTGILLDNTSGGTNVLQVRLKNTGGDMRVGVENSTGGTMQVGTSAYAAVFGNQANYPTQFTTNGTVRMTLDASGNLGLGTATPNFSAGSAGSTALTISATASARNALLEFNGTRTSTGNISSYIRFYNNAAASPFVDIQAIRGSSDTTGSLAIFTSGTQAMTLDASGNLTLAKDKLFGIATSDGSDNGYLALCGAGADGSSRGGHIYLSGNERSGATGTVVIAAGNVSGGIIEFRTGADAERARITSGGYFKASNSGSYQNSTGSYHEFNGAGSGNAVTYFNHSDNVNPYGIEISYTALDPNDTAKPFIGCYGTTTLRAQIRSNGGLANYSTNNVNLASDERLKKDIAPLASTWDKLKAIEVVNFRYKDCNEGDPALYGVIAQQVQPIVPELVVVTREAVEAKDAVLDEDGNEVTPAVQAAPEYYGIREQPMYWLAIKALQEAQARIEALEVEVAALKAGA